MRSTFLRRLAEYGLCRILDVFLMRVDLKFGPDRKHTYMICHELTVEIKFY